jgi:hypothetical protein
MWDRLIWTQPIRKQLGGGLITPDVYSRRPRLVLGTGRACTGSVSLSWRFAHISDGGVGDRTPSFVYSLASQIPGAESVLDADKSACLSRFMPTITTQVQRTRRRAAGLTNCVKGWFASAAQSAVKISHSHRQRNGPRTRDLLPNSIENDRLALFCCAALSMAAPRRVNLPSTIRSNGILRSVERSRVERSQLASSADLTGLDFFFAPFLPFLWFVLFAIAFSTALSTTFAVMPLCTAFLTAFSMAFRAFFLAFFFAMNLSDLRVSV